MGEESVVPFFFLNNPPPPETSPLPLPAALPILAASARALDRRGARLRARAHERERPPLEPGPHLRENDERRDQERVGQHVGPPGVKEHAEALAEEGQGDDLVDEVEHQRVLTEDDQPGRLDPPDLHHVVHGRQQRKDDPEDPEARQPAGVPVVIEDEIASGEEVRRGPDGELKPEERPQTQHGGDDEPGAATDVLPRDRRVTLSARDGRGEIRERQAEAHEEQKDRRREGHREVDQVIPGPAHRALDPPPARMVQHHEDQGQPAEAVQEELSSRRRRRHRRYSTPERRRTPSAARDSSCVSPPPGKHKIPAWRRPPGTRESSCTTPGSGTARSSTSARPVPTTTRAFQSCTTGP